MSGMSPEVAERLAKQDERLSALQATLDRAVDLITNPAPPPAPKSPLPDIPKGNSDSDSTTSGFRPRPAEPPRFSGKREEGRAFIEALEMYALSARFDSQQAAIRWALTYFDSGRAQSFRRDYIRGTRNWSTWEDFLVELRTEFLPHDERTRSMLALETDAYHQGSRNMEDYIDSFRLLCEDAGYVLSGARDATATQLVFKFRKGMNSGVATQIATSGASRPADNDLLGWVEAARQFARAQQEASAFHSALRGPPRTFNRVVFPPADPPSRPPAADRFRLPPPVYRSPPAEPVLPPGEPMDIGKTNRSARPALARPGKSNACFRCGQSGHFSRDCPQNAEEFRIRALSDLTDEDIEEILADRAARLDMAEIQAKAEAEKSPVTSEEPRGDF